MLIDASTGILIAAGLGSLIGLEREIHGQPAGLRTHMILATGAALAAVLSIAYSEFLSASGDINASAYEYEGQAKSNTKISTTFF